MGTNAMPFAQGETYYGIAGSIDTDDYGGVGLEGKKVTFLGENGDDLCGRIMRNTSGITMYAGMSVLSDVDYRHQRFDGYTYLVGGASSGIIDPDLSSNGVRNGDLCIVFNEGPCNVMPNENPGEVIAAGDWAIAMTDSASTNALTGAGKVLLVAGADTTPDPMTGVLGVFMEAATTADCTGATLVLCDLNIP